ncbi:SET and MYND domain-containing protein 4 [Pieris rapae]|uniref:SET and MYND domain-containing protein 4 n=1 Tax=Pieris rapae TaxID=64459 RepID=UPI001E280793|nr:SET and MYND domain-containing protein 4 [Pieris rapae]
MADVVGFFKHFYEHVNSSLDDVTKKNFANLETNSKRIAYLSGLPLIKSYDLTPEVEKCESGGEFPVNKRLEKARLFKDQGNMEVQRGDWVKAMQLYSLSLIHMPKKETEELAIVLANRSAALNHLEQHEESLADIRRCLALGYPRHLRYKVYERRARCLLVLKRNQDAVKAFQDTISSLDDAKNLNQEKKQKLLTDAKLMLEVLNKGLVLAGNPKDPKPRNKVVPKPKLPGKHNIKYPAASEAIQIDQDDTKGRYASASRDIQVGETLLIEKPHSGVLLAEYAATHCQNCFAKCPIPLSCPTCPNVIFCSDHCQDVALTSYHAYECPILPLIWKSGCSITCHIALRMITQNSKQHFKELSKYLDEKPTGPYNTNDYRNIYNLVSHEDKRTKQDLLHRSHMAVFLVKLLELSGYFDTKPRETLIDMDEIKTMGVAERYRDDVELFGGLILKNIQVLQFNAHEVFELQCSKPRLEQNVIKHNGDSVFVAGAVFPSLALFNHSCDPSVVRYFSGPYIIVRSVKNIKKGEEVAENYGPIFTVTSKEERQAILKDQYWFDCTCEPCQQNWPRYDQMNETYMRFRCDSGQPCPNVLPVTHDCTEFMVKCGLCQQFTNILKGLKALQDTEVMYRLGRAAMEEGKYGEAIKKLIEVLKLYDSTLAPPYKSYYDCVQDLRRCMLSLGNFSIA